MVTDCAEVYVPPTGLNVGVAAGGAIVYAPVATALLVKPLSTAMALIVSELETEIAVVYWVEDVVGVELSVV